MDTLDIISLIGILIGVAGVIVGLSAKHDLKKEHEERLASLFQYGHENRDNNSSKTQP